MNKWIYIFLLLSMYYIPVLGQHSLMHPSLNIDTSYTIYSAYNKYIKNYPFISIASYKPKNKIIVQNDLVFCKYGNRNMHLDLYAPEIEANDLIPAVVLIHDGGWSTGDKSLLSQYALAFADSGYVCICPEYRFSPEAQYPAAVIDVKTAVKWLFANAQKYHIDTLKVTIMGSSAGGQLATLVGVTSTTNKFNPKNNLHKQKIRINAIIDIDGVLAFIHPLSEEGGKQGKPGSAEKWFGVHYKIDSTKWIEASPLTYTGPETPPILFIASSFPRFNAGREEMVEIMDKFGIYNDEKVFSDAPHSFWLFNPWFEPTREKIIDFLGKVNSGKY
jgi:acetyl esterase/lipase